MTDDERQAAAEWFRNRASQTPMRGAKIMYERVAEALSENCKLAHWERPYTPFLCPVCGHYSDTRTRFCPHCGSKMMNAEVNDSE